MHCTLSQGTLQRWQTPKYWKLKVFSAQSFVPALYCLYHPWNIMYPLSRDSTKVTDTKTLKIESIFSPIICTFFVLACTTHKMHCTPSQGTLQRRLTQNSINWNYLWPNHLYLFCTGLYQPRNVLYPLPRDSMEVTEPQTLEFGLFLALSFVPFLY